MGTAWWTVALVAGCGRIDFVERVDAMSELDARTFPCPAGFVPIVGNPALGTSDFCAMATEARAWADANGDTVVEETELDADGCSVPTCDADWPMGTHVPVSILPVQAEPWRSVSKIVAQAACASLGPGYDLMANREWMTIARAAELEPLNWYGGIVGNMRIVQGQIDDVGTSAIVDPNDGYTGTGNNENEPVFGGWEERRTLYAGAAILWDMPGNVQEWIDWTLGPPLDGAPTPCSTGQLTTFACPGVVAEDFQSIAGTYDDTYGVGIVIGGSGNATRRGGQGGDNDLGIAGIYALNMNRNVGDIFGGTSFRCVYRP